ncbi:solute carrier family 22 member 23 isoform X3 [Buteo buteo]|uniref:solute carrier family 22 member 23 isoform X3 n=1 Tax=Buteo buteo TaxID=30397 RepID=UPI003EBBB950
MAIDRRREAGGGGRPLPEENGSVPGAVGGGPAAAAPPGPPPANVAGAEIQAVPVPPPPPPAACSPLLLDYDGSVLPFLGGLGGGYQRTLVLLTWVPALFIGFSKFSDSFLLDQPDFWCREADGQGNWSGSLAPSHANHSGNGSIFPPPGLPTPAGGNASECDCHEWHYRIRAGLVQNVVSKEL